MTNSFGGKKIPKKKKTSLEGSLATGRGESHEQ